MGNKNFIKDVSNAISLWKESLTKSFYKDANGNQIDDPEKFNEEDLFKETYFLNEETKKNEYCIKGSFLSVTFIKYAEDGQTILQEETISIEELEEILEV